MSKKSHANPIVLLLLLVAIFFSLASSCERSALNINRTPSQTADNEVILEVWTDASETSYPYGNLLNLRLHNNGTVEFDYFSPKKPGEVNTQLILERKVAKLSQADFDKLASILKKPDLLNASETYEPRRIRPMSVDSSVKKKVTFLFENRNKTVVLKEDDNHLYLDDPPSYVSTKPNTYPKSLVELLKSVDFINLSLRRHIDPESR